MELFTWSFLATFAVCAAATAVIVQLLKNTKPFSLIPTQLFSYGVALIVFNITALVLGSWDWPAFGIAFLNSAIVGLSSNGAYDAAKKIITRLTNDTGETSDSQT
jgi:hypothetical protein